MANLTNYTAGPRGVNIKQGSGVVTRWLEPGETLELGDGEEVHGTVPDLGKPADAHLSGVDLADMNRAQLEATARAEMDFSDYSDDQLREGIAKRREYLTDTGAPNGQADGPDLSILDGSVADMKASLDALDIEHLKALRDAEAKGKNRQSALDAIDQAIASKPAI
jgi:hypothetical protein